MILVSAISFQIKIMLLTYLIVKQILNNNLYILTHQLNVCAFKKLFKLL